MGGLPWSSDELSIIIEGDMNLYKNKELCTLLKQAGTERTITSVRSKLYELRKDDELFDSQNKKWHEDAPERVKQRS